MAHPAVTTETLHPETGEPMVRGLRRQSIELAGKTYEVDVPGWYTASGAGLHSADDYSALEAVMKQVSQERAAAGLPSLRELARERAAARREKKDDDVPPQAS
ncbi:hypothetical protein ACFOGJ_07580 [Marinibaculum pumilum]|uniref:Type II toxin-antitoxin system MqsA family antitoxin n=1 Tax=Marinibaculum pumilum TaxID=1766165 RepID=A0ABV7KXH5_9PROT